MQDRRLQSIICCTRTVARLAASLCVLIMLAGCNLNAGREATIKTALEHAKEEAKAQRVDAALGFMDEAVKSPELIRDDYYDGFGSYSEPPTSPGVGAILETYDQIAEACEKVPNYAKAAEVHSWAIEFVRHWDACHGTAPDRDWRMISATTTYANALAEWGKQTADAKHIDQAMQELKPIVDKPDSVPYKTISSLTFDAGPAMVGCGPTFVEDSLKNIAVAYDQIHEPAKAAEARSLGNKFALAWDAAHERETMGRPPVSILKFVRLVHGSPCWTATSRPIIGRLVKGSRVKDKPPGKTNTR